MSHVIQTQNASTQMNTIIVFAMQISLEMELHAFQLQVIQINNIYNDSGTDIYMIASCMHVY